MAAFPDEQTAIDFLIARRWPGGVCCPLCGNVEQKRIHRMNRSGQSAGSAPTNGYRCYECRRNFSFKVGTIFEQSKVPIRSWLVAIWLATTSKKGVTSTALAEALEVPQKTAWHMRQRLRQAAASPSFSRAATDNAELRDAAPRTTARRSDLLAVRSRPEGDRDTRLPPFRLEMPFADAIDRLIAVKPGALAALAGDLNLR